MFSYSHKRINSWIYWCYFDLTCCFYEYCSYVLYGNINWNRSGDHLLWLRDLLHLYIFIFLFFQYNPLLWFKYFMQYDFRLSTPEYFLLTWRWCLFKEFEQNLFKQHECFLFKGFFYQISKLFKFTTYITFYY
jgi:hypothetical protein